MESTIAIVALLIWVMTTYYCWQIHRAWREIDAIRARERRWHCVSAPDSPPPPPPSEKNWNT